MKEMHKNLPAAMKTKKHHDHKPPGLEYKNKIDQLLHLFVMQRNQ